MRSDATGRNRTEGWRSSALQNLLKSVQHEKCFHICFSISVPLRNRNARLLNSASEGSLLLICAFFFCNCACSAGDSRKESVMQ